MGLHLRELKLNLVATDEAFGGRVESYPVDIVARRTYSDEDPTIPCGWRVHIDPRFHGRDFDLTTDDLDKFLSELVTYRGLIRKLEHILMDAKGGE
jgi:hypothetical protein